MNHGHNRRGHHSHDRERETDRTGLVLVEIKIVFKSVLYKNVTGVMYD